MSDIITIVNEKLSMQLDSVSWNKKYNLIVVGAYMIDPSSTEKRIGKIFLIQLIFQDDELTVHKLLQEVDTSGVLDLRWEPNAEQQLVVATSTSLELFELVEEGRNKLRHLDTLELPAMALYIQWMDMNSLVYSDSDGAINVVTTNPLQKSSSKKVHDNLTWVVQYSPGHNLLFAGSDEGKFTGFLLENLEDEEKHYNKKFEVGVTSIIFFGKNILAVGSYDDTLRIFTIDTVDPIVLSLKRKIEFGGAVWRTLTFPTNQSDPVDKPEEKTREAYIVAACARNGVHIVRLNCQNWAYKPVTTCLEFEGFLAYGLDAKLEQRDATQILTVSSCYFDNQQFHMWKTTIPE